MAARSGNAQHLLRRRSRRAGRRRREVPPGENARDGRAVGVRDLDQDRRDGERHPRSQAEERAAESGGAEAGHDVKCTDG